MNSLVSIIIPTYKRPERLKKSLESVRKQTYDNVEIIVIDDNGDKNKTYRNQTKKVITEFNDLNISYIQHAENSGANIARNTGIKYSNGKYISFLDDDDMYLSNKIEKQVAKFNISEVENLGLVYCQISFSNDKNEITGNTSNYFKGNRSPLVNNLAKTIAGTPSIMAKKTVLLEVGGFANLSSGQDWFLMHEILLAGFGVDFISESLVKAVIHSDDRISLSNNKIQHLKEHLPIKKACFNLLDKKEINNVMYFHNMQIANIYKFKNKLKSFKYFIRSLSYKIYSPYNLRYLSSLLMNEKQIKKTKKIIMEYKKTNKY